MRGNTPTTQRAGLCLVEVLMGLAIAAMLLTAVATALVSMAGGIRQNDAYIRSQQAARVTLNYLTSSVRRAKEIDLGAINPTSAAEVQATQLTVVDATDDYGQITKWRTFSWDATTQTLSLSTNGGPLGRILANVSSLKFRSSAEPLASDSAHFRFRYVTIELALDTRDMSGISQTSSFSGTAYARSVDLTQ